MDKIILLGAGGQADEITSYLSESQNVAFSAVSKDYMDSSDPKLIDINNGEEYKNYKTLVAVGAPQLKRDMVGAWQSDASYVTLISNTAKIDKTSTVGIGTIIAPGAIVTTNVRIGKHALVNIGATISHDCVVGDYVTISPGVHIAGKVVIGDGVFIGVGAIISNNIKIASGCVIGAGAVVVDDILAENSVAVGVPAKVIKNNEGWTSEI